MPEPRVMLVYMPFGVDNMPSIGISLLKAVLEREQIPCDIRYFHFDFMDLVDGEPRDKYLFYYMISQRSIYFLGEWIFSTALFGDDAQQRDAEFAAFLARQADNAGAGRLVRSGEVRNLYNYHDLTPEILAKVCDLKKRAADFIESCLRSTPFDSYSVVGFTSTFSQNFASLALAKRLKERYPEIRTIIGGANTADVMGEQLVRSFPFLDGATLGEAEPIIADFVRGLAHRTDLSGIPGIAYRTPAGTVRRNPGFPRITHLDELPFPDYEDYFEALRYSRYESLINTFLPFESSRGCWWGTKHHCTFCGLNASSMAFHSKSKDRFLSEVCTLREKYRSSTLYCVDNILDMKYFNTVLPELERLNLDVTFFYEIKSNLTKEQFDLLAGAKMSRLQPGIESFSSGILTEMRKGVTYLQNVQTMKWARERNIALSWNLLYGFPGETRQDYEEIRRRMIPLKHLEPPGGFGPIRVDRFSPYFNDPHSFGLKGITPVSGYHFLYPFAPEAIFNLAYHFDYEYANGRSPELNAFINETVGPIVAEWKQSYDPFEISLAHRAGVTTTLIRDKRNSGLKRYIFLEGQAHRVYTACAKICSRRRLAELLDEETEIHEEFDALWSDLAIFTGCEEDGKNQAAWDELRLDSSNECVHLRKVGDPTKTVRAALDEFLLRLCELDLIAVDGEHCLALSCSVSERRVASVAHRYGALKAEPTKCT